MRSPLPNPSWPLVVVASGLGLFAAGGFALWHAVGGAAAAAREAGRRAAEAGARELRLELSEPGRLIALGGLEVGVADGAVVVSEDLASPPAEPDPFAAVPGDIAALLDAGDLAAEDLQRLANRSNGLGPAAGAWLDAWIARRALRGGDAEAAAALADRAARRAAQHPPWFATAAGLALLAADRNADFPAVAWRRLLQATPARVAAVAESLGARGRDDLASALTAAAVDLRRRRALVDHAARLLPRAQPEATATLLGDAAALLALGRDADGGVRAVVAAPPLEVVAKALDGHASAAGRAVAAGIPGAIPIVAGSVALAPLVGDDAGAGGLWGLAAVLVAFATTFAFALAASRRAARREALALATRADFLQSVTHELKTPLASIRLLAERLHEGRVVDADKQRRHHALLAGEAGRLSVLIENVLDLGRIERGERGYDRRRRSLDPIVERAVALFAPIADADGLTLDVRLDAPDAAAHVDADALVQALVNVLENARRYARTGGRIEVTSSIEDGAYRLAVRDHGPGVPTAERDAIFERFVRGAAQRDGSVPGVGLGLHIARRIVRALDGELVCAAPMDGPGALFAFTWRIDGATR